MIREYLGITRGQLRTGNGWLTRVPVPAAAAQ